MKNVRLKNYLRVFFVGLVRHVVTALMCLVVCSAWFNSCSAAFGSPSQADIQNDQIKKPRGNLGFGADELVAALQTVQPSFDQSALTISEKLVTVKLSHARILCRRQKDTLKIFDVVVKGNGTDFVKSIAMIVKLVNPLQESESDREKIVAQFTQHWQAKKVPEEYLQFQGVRYHLLEIRGVPTFHCINARSEDRELVRARNLVNPARDPDAGNWKKP